MLSVTDVELMGRGDGEARVLSRPTITKRLLEQGWHVEVIHADLESFYASRLSGKRNYGVWHTYQETIDEMNLLHAQYPALTTAPVSIGQTGEGRDIWAIKVSDNPEVDEDEPEVLFDGVHHAREIMTVEMNLYFARYLCENYGTDPIVTFLVDNREVWFVPILNVDGFVYNETTEPLGGGMWRKNRSFRFGDGLLRSRSESELPVRVGRSRLLNRPVLRGLSGSVPRQRARNPGAHQPCELPSLRHARFLALGCRDDPDALGLHDRAHSRRCGVPGDRGRARER